MGARRAPGRVDSCEEKFNLETRETNEHARLSPEPRPRYTSARYTPMARNPPANAVMTYLCEGGRGAPAQRSYAMATLDPAAGWVTVGEEGRGTGTSVSVGDAAGRGRRTRRSRTPRATHRGTRSSRRRDTRSSRRRRSAPSDPRRRPRECPERSAGRRWAPTSEKETDARAAPMYSPFPRLQGGCWEHRVFTD